MNDVQVIRSRAYPGALVLMPLPEAFARNEPRESREKTTERRRAVREIFREAARWKWTGR
jgi:hypothetical protein